MGFREMDWEKLLKRQLPDSAIPWVPPLVGNSDTSHFDGAEVDPDERNAKVDTSGWDRKFGEPTNETEATFLREKESKYLKKASSSTSFYEESSALGAASSDNPGTFDIFSKAMCID